MENSIVLISKEYQELNKRLHDTRPTYGAGHATSVYYKLVEDTYDEYNCSSLLEYGCGKGALKQSLINLNVHEYDPCIEGKDSDPIACDMLTCLDVMEHIEPDCLDNVLAHIKTKFNKVAFITVSLIPAQAILADGRNAHILLKPVEWWLTRFKEDFEVIKHMVVEGHELVVLLGKS